MSSEFSPSGSTPRPTILPPPNTEERAWQVLRQYLSAHPLEPAATPTIPIGAPTELLPWIHAESIAGVNDAMVLGTVVLPNFPQRNLPDTQDNDIVLWQYYRSRHAYEMAQRNEILKQQIPRPPRNEDHDHTPKPKLAPPKTFHGQQS